MPRVPSVESWQVSQNNAPFVPVQAPSGPSGGAIAGQQLQDAGAAAQRVNDVGARIALSMQEQANQVRVNDAVNKARKAAQDLAYDPSSGYLNLKGDAALTRPSGQLLPDEYGSKLTERLSEIAGSLGNDAQRRQFDLNAQDLQAQFHGQVQQHMLGEFRTHALSSQDGTINLASVDAARNWDKPDVMAPSIAAAKAAVVQKGIVLGWSASQTGAAMLTATSEIHATAVASAIQAGRIDYANAYMKANAAELTPAAVLKLEGQLKATDQAQAAIVAATEIWGAAGPKADGQPVELDKMEALARERFPSDPLKAKATVTELRERASAFNSSEKERAAAGVNAVMLAYSKGAGLNAITAMPEFLSLPGKEQADIRQHISDRNHMLMVRSAEDRNRLEAEQAKKAFPAFLQYSDPEVLSGMSRAQVTALQPVLGNQLTEHLATKWDSMQRREGRLAASMDKEDFDHVADQMGLSPFNAKTEDAKRQLGELKFRVEQLIDQAQAVKKAPLDRQEKQELMRQEMARRVAVPGWFGSDEVPVIQLTPAQAAKVAVPPADRQQIVDALQAMYRDNPNNPAYAPTDENVRRLYLRRQSPAARLIPPAK